MIYIENILTKDELSYLKELCYHYKVSDIPKSMNYYVRMKVDDADFLKKIENKFNFIIGPIKNKKYMLIPNESSWINKVGVETNKNDSFHYDTTEMSLVIYINDNFEGGELQYIENGIRKEIKIKENIGVVMEDKLKHRVLPVTNGIRYSMVCFFVESFSKINKTLM